MDGGSRMASDKKSRSGSLISMLSTALFYREPIVDNKIFVMTFDDSFSCNPASIARELLLKDGRPEIVWAVSSNSDLTSFPDGINKVVRGSKEMFRQMKTSRIWLDNGVNCAWYFMPKRRGQIYINTWHGSMGIKKLSGNFLWKMRARRCGRITDYLVTNSTFEEDVFRNTFWKKAEFLKEGHPRNDILFDEKRMSAARTEVFSKYGLDPESSCKILLYAPTFRDGKDLDIELPDLKAVASKLSDKTGDEWRIFVKVHPRDRNSHHDFGPDAIDVSGFPDMSKIMVCADFAISDYSSWVYDYVLLKRPVVLYCPDKDEYTSTRGFYYPLETTPFPVVTDNEGLLKAVADLKDETYKASCDEFLSSKGCYEKGTSSGRTAYFILDKCRGLL